MNCWTSPQYFINLTGTERCKNGNAIMRLQEFVETTFIFLETLLTVPCPEGGRERKRKVKEVIYEIK
jgi:hypothetical protein